ncbi:MAG: DUF3021 domain-containing protein [Defluviitaleaceae bacterium]|nr:DUF3021 domain-containing protein [Defluviitaleaceae bacterium]
MLKKTIKQFLLGVTLGSTLFVIIVIVTQFISGGGPVTINNFALEATTSMVLSGVAVASSFLIWEIERLSELMKLIIHFAFVLVLFFVVGLLLGWISFDRPWSVANMVIQTVVIYAIYWTGFTMHEKAEAKKINEALKKRNEEQNLP